MKKNKILIISTLIGLIAMLIIFIPKKNNEYKVSVSSISSDGNFRNIKTKEDTFKKYDALKLSNHKLVEPKNGKSKKSQLTIKNTSNTSLEHIYIWSLDEIDTSDNSSQRIGYYAEKLKPNESITVETTHIKDRSIDELEIVWQAYSAYDIKDTIVQVKIVHPNKELPPEQSNFVDVLVLDIEDSMKNIKDN